MSWLFSRALVEASLGVNFSAGTQSPQLNARPTPQAYCAPDKMTDFSRLSRFGMTFAHSTEIPGEAVLTWCLADSLARTLAPQERALESAENARAYGQNLPASFTKLDRNTCSWKTAPYLLLGDSALFCKTWPRSGLMRAGECWELPPLALPTSASESGLWPTPTASLGTKGGRVTPRKSREGGTLIEAASARTMWRTPSASLVEPKSTVVKLTGRKPTDPQVGLADQVGGSLNPTWVEWLMGWPLGWTDLKQSETGKSPSAPLPHGKSLEVA